MLCLCFIWSTIIISIPANQCESLNASTESFMCNNSCIIWGSFMYDHRIIHRIKNPSWLWALIASDCGDFCLTCTADENDNVQCTECMAAYYLDESNSCTCKWLLFGEMSELTCMNVSPNTGFPHRVIKASGKCFIYSPFSFPALFVKQKVQLLTCFYLVEKRWRMSYG